MKQESKALVTGAAEKLVAFVSACERELTAQAVNGYLCDGFAELCRALNGLRTEKLVTPKVRPVASRLSHSVGSSARASGCMSADCGVRGLLRSD